MIDRNVEEYILFFEEWKVFVFKNYFNSDKWEWFMEYYVKFDKLDFFDK